MTSHDAHGPCCPGCRYVFVTSLRNDATATPLVLSPDQLARLASTCSSSCTSGGGLAWQPHKNPSRRRMRIDIGPPTIDTVVRSAKRSGQARRARGTDVQKRPTGVIGPRAQGVPVTLGYHLDTGIVSAPVSKRPDPAILQRLNECGPECAIAHRSGTSSHVGVGGCQRQAPGRPRSLSP